MSRKTFKHELFGVRRRNT